MTWQFRFFFNPENELEYDILEDYDEDCKFAV
jgi:hypothetical protein